MVYGADDLDGGRPRGRRKGGAVGATAPAGLGREYDVNNNVRDKSTYNFYFYLAVARNNERSVKTFSKLSL